MKRLDEILQRCEAAKSDLDYIDCPEPKDHGTLPLVVKALQKAVEALRFITTAHERSDQDETAPKSNFSRLRASRWGAEKALAEIHELLET